MGYNKKYDRGLEQLGFMFDEYNVAQTALAISRLHLSSHFVGGMIDEYSELIKFTNDVAGEILEVRKGRDHLETNEFLRYPKETRDVISSISKLHKVKNADIDLEDVSEDIGYLVDHKKIKKTLDVLYEDGYIYLLEPYKQMKLAPQRWA